MVRGSGRPQKPPGVCHFCGTVGTMTKEHLWPQWLSADAIVDAQQSTRRLGFDQNEPGHYEELPTTVVHKDRSVLTDRVRKICRTCNEGWMSRLEQTVRGPLELLTAASYSFGRTALTREQVTLLAAWALKTSWMRELDQERKPIPTQAQRRHLMEQLRPPAYTTVWAAKYNGVSNFATKLAQIETKDSRVPWSSASSRRVLLTALVFNGLVLLVRTDEDWGVPPTPVEPSIWHQLWPLTDAEPTAARPMLEALSWPPAMTADDAEVARRSNIVSTWLRLPETQSFLRHPDGITEIHRN